MVKRNSTKRQRTKDLIYGAQEAFLHTFLSWNQCFGAVYFFFLAEAHYSLSSLMPTSSEQNVLRHIWFSSVFSCNWVNTEGHRYKCSAAINKRVLPCRGQLQCSIYNKQKTKLRLDFLLFPTTYESGLMPLTPILRMSYLAEAYRNICRSL